MGKKQTQCPDCGNSITQGETKCDNCGLNLVTGESYQSKLEAARGKQTSPKGASRVGGLGLALGFGLIILAGFMYQRNIMKLFREQPDEYQEYVREAQRVQYLVDRSHQAQTMSKRKKYRDEATATGQSLMDSLQAEGGQENGGQEDIPESVRESREAFSQNLRQKVEYYLDRLPEK